MLKQPSVILSAGLISIAAIIAFVNWLPLVLLMLLPLFAAGLYRVAQHKSGWLDGVLWVATLLLGFFIAIYRPAGFSYPPIWQFESLSNFTLYLNSAKAIGGYLVLVWLIRARAQSPSLALLPSLLIACAGIALVISAGMGCGLAFAPKLPEGFVYFILLNLLVTVVAEEAFFRLLLQNRLVHMMGNSRAAILAALGITALIFALAHTTIIGPAFFLFLFAGFVYGLVYTITKRFSMALVVHFGTNLSHFLLLEYPLPARLLNF